MLYLSLKGQRARPKLDKWYILGPLNSAKFFTTTSRFTTNSEWMLGVRDLDGGWVVMPAANGLVYYDGIGFTDIRIIDTNALAKEDAPLPIPFERDKAFVPLPAMVESAVTPAPTAFNLNYTTGAAPNYEWAPVYFTPDGSPMPEPPPTEPGPTRPSIAEMLDGAAMINGPEVPGPDPAAIELVPPSPEAVRAFSDFMNAPHIIDMPAREPRVPVQLRNTWTTDGPPSEAREPDSVIAARAARDRAYQELMARMNNRPPNVPGGIMRGNPPPRTAMAAQIERERRIGELRREIERPDMIYTPEQIEAAIRTIDESMGEYAASIERQLEMATAADTIVNEIERIAPSLPSMNEER